VRTTPFDHVAVHLDHTAPGLAQQNRADSNPEPGSTYTLASRVLLPLAVDQSFPVLRSDITTPGAARQPLPFWSAIAGTHSTVRWVSCFQRRPWLASARSGSLRLARTSRHAPSAGYLCCVHPRDRARAL